MLGTLLPAGEAVGEQVVEFFQEAFALDVGFVGGVLGAAVKQGRSRLAGSARPHEPRRC